MFANRRVFLSCAVAAVVAFSVVARAEDYKLERLKSLPKGVPEAVAKQLDPNGVRVTSADGPVCEIWLRKEIPVLADFKPTPAIQYPFQVGQWVGLLRLPDDGFLTDFRGQEIQPGLHTIRYAQQPQDGNHFSPQRDFLLLLPLSEDPDPTVVLDYQTLVDKSKLSGEGEHPANYPLFKPDKPSAEPKLVHDEEKDYWLVDWTATTTAGGKTGRLPLRFVVVGVTDE